MGVSLPSRAERGTATHVRLTRAGVAVVLAFALLAAYYAWTATSSSNPFNKVTPFGFNVGDDDYYNLQADAFLHGRLWVDVPIDPKLLTAKNPYAVDIRSGALGLPDGSFYKGRYYLSWGPAPAVTTFLPPRLVGLRIQENLAVTLYCFFGTLFAAMTLTLLVRRLVPGTSRAVIWNGSATIALATSMPWSLRTPTVYQVAITAAFCFMMAGLLVLVRELLRDEPPRRPRLAAAGTLFGLAVLSRPTMAFVVVGVVALTWVLRPEARRTTVPVMLAIPMIAGVIFMIYNMARFSGPLDFGNKWQTSARDVRQLPFNDLANLPPALYAYLIAPLHMTVGFPYFHLPPPPNAPLASSSLYQGEPTGSMLWTVPFTLLVLAFVARRRPAATEHDTSVVKPVVLTLLAIGIFVLVAGAYGVPGYTERYKLDFLPWIVMAATLGWTALIQHASTPGRATWWLRGGIALGAWGILVGVAVSFTGNYDSLDLFNQGRFQSLERAFSPVPTLATKIAGRPMIAAIRAPRNAYSFSFTVLGGYTSLDISGASVTLVPQQAAEVTIVSPNDRNARLSFHAATKTSGTFMVFQSAAAETTSALVHDGSAATLPLHLQRGINYVTVGLTAGADVPSGARAAVQLRDFRVR
jgi:hypothetical protein